MRPPAECSPHTAFKLAASSLEFQRLTGRFCRAWRSVLRRRTFSAEIEPQLFETESPDMPDIVGIPLADLLVDTGNARLKDEQPSQPAAILALATKQGRRLLKLAAHIVEHGLDPMSLPAVIPTSDQKKRYTVIEGNRRIVALKALETPSLVSPALDAAQQTRLNRLAQRFARDPVSTVNCVLFESERDLAEINNWVTLRHTGMNEGVGLVEWGSDEKDRFAARHGRRSPAGQIMDFVEKHGGDAGKTSGRGGIITSLKRLVSSPEVRERLGIELSKGEIRSWYPAEEVAKSLTRVVEALATGEVKVGDIYDRKQRITYVKRLKKADLPDPATRLPAPVPLAAADDVAAAGKAVSPKAKPRRKRTRSGERTALIPRDCQLSINPPRMNAIYIEGLSISTDQYANASSVLLRVFVELSVDHYVEQHKLIATEQERRNTPLAKRLKLVAADLVKRGTISASLETAVTRIADSGFVLAASTINFNQYVHNPYVFPKPSELRIAWDELQPFMEKLWP